MTDVAIARLQQVQEYHGDRIDDHESRMRSVESANLKLAVQVGTFVGIVSSVVSVFGVWLLKHLGV